MKKFLSIFGGVTLIAIAVAIILTQTGTISLGLAIWQIILGIVAISMFITSAVKLEVGGIVVSLGLAYISFGERIGLPHIDLWIVIVVTILLAIGLSMIIPKKKRKIVDKDYAAYEAEDQVGEHQQATYNDASGYVNCSNKFGQLARYVKSDDFKGADISNGFGALKVYFDKANIITSPVRINVTNAFGELQLYIPKEWNVVNKVTVSFASDVRGAENVGDSTEPVVEIVGSNSFGDMVIHRV